MSPLTPLQGCGRAAECCTLAACIPCPRLLSIRDDGPHRCPRCRSDLTLIAFENADLHDAELLQNCPGCGQRTLQLDTRAARGTGWRDVSTCAKLRDHQSQNRQRTSQCHQARAGRRPAARPQQCF